MEDIKKKISSLELTKKEKLIADYILDNFNTIGLSTVTDVAQKIGVSDTSVIRFIRSLGFGGFSDFKKYMGGLILEQVNENLSPSQKYKRTSGSLNKDSVVADVFYKAIDNLSDALQQMESKKTEEIADCLINSKRKFVVAFRGTSCCAQYFCRKARFFLPNIVLCDKAESETMEAMVDLQEGDCVFMFSFPRYSKLNFIIAEHAKQCGAKLIVVTDRVTSPLISLADYYFTVPVGGVGFTNSYVAPLCLAESLAILIGKKLGEKAEPRLKLMDDIINESQLF